MQLRLSCVAILLGVAGAAPAHPAAHPAAPHQKAKPGKLGLRGGKKDVSNVPAQLGMMMAQAQQSLAIAERHHEKAVQKARDKDTDMLSNQASVLGKIIQNFAGELDKSNDILQQAVNASRSVLAMEEPPSVGFQSALVQSRARLSAETDAAQREIRRNTRKREHAVHEALNQADNALEEGSQKLSRKTGDLSQLIDDAKSSLEAIANSAPDSPANATAVAKAPAGKKADEALLKASLAHLNDAKAKSRKAVEAATKKATEDIAKADSEVAKEVAGITKDLSTAEKIEIQRVRGGSKKLF